MSYNGSGTFQINSTGQPVVTGTVISSTAFNALTADLATGLSTAITKDGQTTTTVRIPFAQGVSSTLTTDATSATTGSIITAGGISTQKALWVGTTANVAGTITGAAASFTTLSTSGLLTAAAGVSSTLTTDATSATTGSIVTAGGISTQKALWVGTTSRLVGAVTADSTIASGAITSTGAVTGTALIPSSSTVPTNGTFLPAANTVGFSTNSVERARFDSGGTLNIGTTTTPGSLALVAKTTGGGGGTYIAEFYNTNSSNTGSAYGLLVSAGYNGSSSPALISFTRPDATALGSITQSGGSGVAYNTSSDYRLKENVQPMTGGLAAVAALKPVTYDWVIDQTSGEGFIAHELQAVIPAAVSGEKDAVNQDGSIKAQGVDFSKIVPHLVAAIQELTARLEALEGTP